MRRTMLVGAVVALLAMALPGTALASRPGLGTCDDGTMHAGTYNGFKVKGVCNIEAGAVVWIKGNLKITKGSSLNDHGAEAWLGAEMHITGNVKVRKGAVLGLGWNAPEGTLGPDTVGGNIVANQPLALQIGGVTVGGNLKSYGGGTHSTNPADFRNFPIKDNAIHGNLVIGGWRGGWIGVIRNHIDGNAIIYNNVSVLTPEGPGAFFDSTEVMGSDLSAIGGPKIPQVIGGNLICHGNVPQAQINMDDFGDYNVVAGLKLGECRDL